VARKGEATRARLLEAARTVFERDGFSAARVTDIAEEAGMVASGVYHYFDSKEAIFRELVRSQEEALVATGEWEDGLLASASDLEAIRHSVERYLDRFREQAGLVSVIEQVARHDPEVNAIRLAIIDDFVVRAEGEIRRLQDEGVADPALDPRITADALIAMASRLAELWLVEDARDYDVDRVTDTLTTILANVLGISRG